MEDDPDEPAFRDYREYLETKLTQPLVVGQKYCAQFYASVASRTHYASNNLGIYLHEDNITQDNQNRLSCMPQIINTEILRIR